MNKLTSLAILALLLLACCNNASNNKETKKVNQAVAMNDISLTFSGIQFTKGVNDAENHYTVNDSILSVDGITGSNYFISPDGGRHEATAPILLAEIDNTKPFTFSTRVESNIEKIYDAGTVYIFIDNENWLKFAFERDEKFRCRIVTVRTENSSDDNNHDIIEQEHVYMRISSNSKQIGYYYSLDGKDWNLARIYRNNYPQKIWLGLSSQSPKQGNNLTYFKEMTLTGNNVSNYRLGE